MRRWQRMRQMQRFPQGTIQWEVNKCTGRCGIPADPQSRRGLAIPMDGRTKGGVPTGRTPFNGMQANTASNPLVLPSPLPCFQYLELPGPCVREASALGRPT